MSTDRHKRIVLVLAADDNYACPMAVTLYSALANLNTGWSVDLYLIDGGIQPENKRRIEHIVGASDVPTVLNWTQVDKELIDGLPIASSWLNASTYLRLFIPQIVPSHCAKAIYLDSDLIVDASLSSIWTQSFDEAGLLATRDYWIPFVSFPEGIEEYKHIGLMPNTPYFNAGVIVLNTNFWRNQGVTKKAISYLHKYNDSINHADQGVLNAVLAGQWKELNMKWNVPHFAFTKQWRYRVRQWPQSDLKRDVQKNEDELLRAPNILHYASSSKPWKPASHYPQQHLWYRYLWDSGWLSPQARFQSQVQFYSRYYTRATVKALLEGTRPARHRLAAHAPAFVRRLIKRK